MNQQREYEFKAVKSVINGKWMVFESLEIVEETKRVRGSMEKDVAERLARQMTEYHHAMVHLTDSWVSASGGTEMPTKTRSGIRVQYVYNAQAGQHAHLNCESDMIMTDAEITAAFQM